MVIIFFPVRECEEVGLIYGTRTCPVCRKKFWTASRTQVYCSEECRKKREKKQQKNWKRKNKGYYRQWRKAHPDYMAEYAKRRKGEKNGRTDGD